jgi:hypothetical protein
MLGYGSSRSAVHMKRLIHRENVRHHRDLLREATSEPERQRIKALLDEELRKQQEAGDEQ